MECFPKLNRKEIEQNHQHFSERVSLYKKRGLDFLKSREFILEKAENLKGNILEIGSGTGYTTLSLAKAGYEFASIDKDKEAFKTSALNLAYENLLSQVKFYIMDGKSLAFANNSFRNVVIVNLFHHINGVNKILSEADRVLRTAGKLILADFNRSGMEIVNSVHKAEGRIHENSGVTKDYVYSYFHKLGYEIESYDEECHWVLVGEKRSWQ
ncbi:MAG: methyltransferase domain-containing protein [Candidatus Omnitrophica bacterium]|nr:methyltransferase domain-containing protein [Candidatus Omnitrophota bacterium]